MANNNSYGKILLKDAADQEFGSVLNSISMDSNQLRLLADETNSFIMFYINGNDLYILGDNRAPLYPPDSSLPDNTVVKVYYKTILIELLDRGLDSKTQIELRDSTSTITNGNYTLEFGANCPPWCQ